MSAWMTSGASRLKARQSRSFSNRAKYHSIGGAVAPFSLSSKMNQETRDPKSKGKKNQNRKHVASKEVSSIPIETQRQLARTGEDFGLDPDFVKLHRDRYPMNVQAHSGHSSSANENQIFQQFPLSQHQTSLALQQELRLAQSLAQHHSQDINRTQAAISASSFGPSSLYLAPAPSHSALIDQTDPLSLASALLNQQHEPYLQRALSFGSLPTPSFGGSASLQSQGASSLASPLSAYRLESELSALTRAATVAGRNDAIREYYLSLGSTLAAGAPRRAFLSPETASQSTPDRPLSTQRQIRSAEQGARKRFSDPAVGTTTIIPRAKRRRHSHGSPSEYTDRDRQELSPLDLQQDQSMPVNQDIASNPASFASNQNSESFQQSSVRETVHATSGNLKESAEDEVRFFNSGREVSLGGTPMPPSDELSVPLSNDRRRGTKPHTESEASSEIKQQQQSETPAFNEEDEEVTRLQKHQRAVWEDLKTQQNMKARKKRRGSRTSPGRKPPPTFDPSNPPTVNLMKPTMDSKKIESAEVDELVKDSLSEHEKTLGAASVLMKFHKK